MLRSMASWLQPGGAIFVSARLVDSSYRRTLLTLQWLATRRYGAAEWGRSHTRWLHSDGTIQRSFVQYFTPHRLQQEATAAGLTMGPCREGHTVLKPCDRNAHTAARFARGGAMGLVNSGSPECSGRAPRPPYLGCMRHSYGV